MSCSSATFNPASMHPASLPNVYLDSLQTASSVPPKYFFCALGIEPPTGKKTYALAESSVSGDTVSLAFRIQAMPFDEMIPFLSKGIPDDVSGLKHWSGYWVYQPQTQNQTWTTISKIENSDNVKRMLINVYCPKSIVPDEILETIASFKDYFRNVNSAESAYNVRHGFIEYTANDLLVPGDEFSRDQLKLK